jgi:hypothetical protein
MPREKRPSAWKESVPGGRGRGNGGRPCPLSASRRRGEGEAGGGRSVSPMHPCVHPAQVRACVCARVLGVGGRGCVCLSVRARARAPAIQTVSASEAWARPEQARPSSSRLDSARHDWPPAGVLAASPPSAAAGGRVAPVERAWVASGALACVDRPGPAQPSPAQLKHVAVAALLLGLQP